MSAQSAGSSEYTDLTSAEGYISPTKEWPGYDIKQSDGEALVHKLWGTLPLLPGPLWPGVVAPDRYLSMGQIELFEI